MAVFPNFKLTKKGEELLNRCIGEGKVLTFTKFKIGDGVPSGDWRDLQGIVNSFKEFPVTSTSVQQDQTLRVRGYFDNKGFAEDKKFKEIGVYVSLAGEYGEFLYSYTNAGDTGDIIPAESRGFYSRTLDVANYIGYATNITFNIEQVIDNYDFNTEAELKVATFLKKGDKIRLWGRLALGDIKTRFGVVTDTETSLAIDNGLYVHLTGNIVVDDIEQLKVLNGALNGDIININGYYSAGDGAGHKRIISNTAKGFNSITLNNSLYANLIKDSDIKNIILKQTNEYAGIKYELVKKVSEKISLKKINNKFIFSYNDELSSYEKQTIYIKSLSSNTGLGNSMTYPITLNQFKKNLESGLYTKLILEVIMLDEIIFDKELCGILSFPNNHIEIKSFVKGGTWITSCDRMTYENTNENILVYNSSALDRIAHIVEYGTKDNYDIPVLLKKVSDEINLKKGTWCISQGKIKVYPYDIKNTDSIYAVLLSATGFEMTTGSKHITLENINFLIHQSNKGSCTIRNTSSTIHPLYIFKNCKFLGGEQDSLSLNGRYRSAVVDCVAAYGNKDCFNYHTQSKDSIVMEVNCIGYGAGMNKTLTGNQTQHSNNATTTHDGMTIYRFGSVGFNCEGPVLADVHGTKSINIDCVMGMSTTIKGYNSNYHYQSDFNNYNEFILINCKNSIIGDKGTLQNKGVHVIGDCKFICDFNDNITNKIDISDVSLNNVYKAGAINE